MYDSEDCHALADFWDTMLDKYGSTKIRKLGRFADILWLFLMKQLFHSRVLDDHSQLGATCATCYKTVTCNVGKILALQETKIICKTGF